MCASCVSPIGVKISNPMVVTGGAEIIVYGNGFKKSNRSGGIEEEIAKKGDKI